MKLSSVSTQNVIVSAPSLPTTPGSAKDMQHRTPHFEAETDDDVADELLTDHA
jgi:hypothetical protein